ncbi:PAAR domain-containing protein [Pasteurella sp. PK-2025]|uniref:PAAR domain-containing protein n=1 Tax=Pasteurella sp. PK-2025 TaxID=3413133 RepID=UPI003C72818A
MSKGADNVFVNGKPLAMVDLALSVACTRHSPEQKIAQGSETVFVHNKAVSRKGDKTECSATIAEGSPNVFIGSGQATYLEMKSEFTGAQQALFFAVEFLVPLTALLSKGIGKAITQAGKSIAMRGAYVGAAVVGRAKHIYRKSVFKIKRLSFPTNDILLNSANTLDRAGFTKAGRALQKHGSRHNSIFPKTKGNTSEINKQGELKVKEILDNPLTKIISRHHAKYGEIIEYKSPIGGIRFNQNGKNFIGFIEP